MTSSVPGRSLLIGRCRKGAEIARDLCWGSGAGRLLTVYATRGGRRGAGLGGMPGWDLGGVSGRWVRETARRPLAGRQPAGAARLRATSAMPLAHWLICAAGRYAVPFLV